MMANYPEMFDKYRHFMAGVLKEYPEFIFTAPLAWSAGSGWQNSTSFSRDFAPIVQGRGANTFLSGHFSNRHALRWRHLLEDGLLAFLRVTFHYRPHFK